MSKVCSSIKGNDAVTASFGGVFGYSKGPRIQSSYETVTNTYTTDEAIIMKPGSLSMTVKLWGAGGSSGPASILSRSSVGGGGGYAEYSSDVLPGQIYNITIGKPSGGGIGGFNSDFPAGNGGGMSMIHLQSNNVFTVKAVAGGGSGGGPGGGSNSIDGAIGSATGQNGKPGIDPGVGGGAPYGGDSIAGSNGSGGKGSIGYQNYNGTDGEDFVSVVTDLLNVGGRGGDGGDIPDSANNYFLGGAGGSGFGGGGGAGSFGSGAGGGNYSESSNIQDGLDSVPGNSSDPQRGTAGNGGIKGKTSIPGSAGIIVVSIFAIKQSIQLPTESSSFKSEGLVVSGADNSSTGEGGDLSLSGGKSTGGSIGSVVFVGETTNVMKCGENEISMNRTLIPGYDNEISLGTASKRWSEVFAVNGTINTSDKREKKDIVSSTLGLDFVNMLKPVCYKWIEGSRPHYGFISQDLKNVMDKFGVDFGGFTKSIRYKKCPETGKDIEDGDILGIRYNELISPLTKAVQELSRKNELLEIRCTESENKVKINDALTVQMNEIMTRLNTLENSKLE